MILIEEYFDGVTPLTEATAEGKKTYLSGCFMEGNAKNRNGRIYERSDMELAVNQINEAAEQGRHILSHLDHPNTLEIKLDEVAMRLMSAKMIGEQVHCKAEVLSKTPKGAILQSLIDSNVRVGVSSRGSGSVNESSGRVTNYRFVTVDAVATPSCRNAYPETITEALSLYDRGEIVTDLSEQLVNDPIAQKYFEIEMRKFIQEMLTK